MNGLPSPELRPWSWHGVNFQGLGDFSGNDRGAGDPTYCEQNVARYVMYGIAFVSYTVVKELGPEPLFISTVHGTNSVELYWSSPDTNSVYTVESSPALVSPAWTPPPGVNWPLSTNLLTVTSPLRAAYYFRVRAEKAVTTASNAASPR